MNEPVLSYDPTTRKAVIAFPNGHHLTLKDVDQATADAFFKKNAAEFMRRDCVLNTTAGFETRGGSNG